MFHGCARHLCPDLAFGYYLYVVGEKDAFQVTVVRGKTTYSPNLLLPKNRAYRDFLDEKVRQSLGS